MGRLISDRMSYRNHYMCSGEATSLYKSITYLNVDAIIISKIESTDLIQEYLCIGNCFMYPNMYIYSPIPPTKLK